MGKKAALFHEDLDLSGGSAAVAAALKAGIRGQFKLSGTDTILAPNHREMFICGILSGNETAPNTGGLLEVAENARGEYVTGNIDALLRIHRQLGLMIPIPPKATITWKGPDGAGAEQNVCSVIIEDPEMEDVWDITEYERPADLDIDEVIVVEIVTAARVLQTQSGHVDICGRDTAYVDGTTPISELPHDLYVLEIESMDVAGYSGFGLESPGGEANLDFPCVATYPEVYDMKEIFGGALHCKADLPFNLYGYGVTTATGTARVTIGIKWVKSV